MRPVYLVVGRAVDIHHDVVPVILHDHHEVAHEGVEKRVEIQSRRMILAKRTGREVSLQGQISPIGIKYTVGKELCAED